MTEGIPVPRMHRWERIFYLLQLLFDSVIILLIFTGTVFLREYWRQLGLTTAEMPGFASQHFFPLLVYHIIALPALFHYVDLYHERRLFSGNRTLGRSFKASLFFCAFNALLYYAFQGLFLFSRLEQLVLLLLLPFGISLSHYLLGRFRCVLRQRGCDLRRVVLVGDPKCVGAFHALILERDDLGYRVEGVCSDESPEEVVSLVRDVNPDDVVLCATSWSAETVSRYLLALRGERVRVRLITNLYDKLISRMRIPVDQFDGVTILDFDSPAPHPVFAFCKRTVDVLAASILLLLLLPVFAFIALLIYLDSPGPIFFVQRRVGMRFREFELVKFRSMGKDAEAEKGDLAPHNEQAGPIFKIRQDPRVTRIGRLLRMYSLDELPQLWNVFKGEMSLVGPRPPLPEEVAEYDDWHRKRLLRPMGLTGLWQVSGRNQLDFEAMFLLDIYYNRAHSVCLDLRILLRTISAVLFREGC